MLRKCRFLFQCLHVFCNTILSYLLLLHWCCPSKYQANLGYNPSAKQYLLRLSRPARCDPTQERWEVFKGAARWPRSNVDCKPTIHKEQGKAPQIRCMCSTTQVENYGHDFQRRRQRRGGARLKRAGAQKQNKYEQCIVLFSRIGLKTEFTGWKHGRRCVNFHCAFDVSEDTQKCSNILTFFKMYWNIHKCYII